MFKYIEKYKSESLYVPALYRRMIADCIHGDNKKLLKRLSDAYPNSFLFRSPEMAKDFAGMKDLTVNPLKVAISSRHYAIWICHQCGNEWQAQIASRVKRNKSRKKEIDENGKIKAGKCPDCFKRENNLLVNYPQLKDIYDEELNDIPLEKLTYRNAGKYIYCLCKNHGSYKIHFRILVNCLHNGISPCALCANENDKNIKRNKRITFEKKYPELCAFWSDKNMKGPGEYSYGSHEIVLWKCPHCGYEWEKQINEMTRHPSCPQCSNNKAFIISDTNLYQKIKTIYNAEENEVPLDRLKKREKIKLHLICPVHGKYELSLETLTNKIKRGIEPCKYCANPKLKQKNDEIKPINNKPSKMFNEAHPELIKEWSDKNRQQPNEISEFSKKEIIWKCKKCGCEWVAKAADRSRGFKNCPTCYPFGKNGRRLADVRPDLRKYYSSENDVAFDELSSHDEESRIWICDKGHKIMKNAANAIKNEEFVCPKCSGRIAAENNNISLNYPELLDDWDYEKNEALGLRPTQMLEGSYRAPYWKCKKCGSSYQLRINRKILYDSEGKNPCPYCRGWLVNETNCLAFTNPEVLQYWDYEANDAAGINPHNVLARNGVMARWICSDCGSHYDMAISERVQRENDDQISCPYCRGWLVNETNCLAFTNPEVLQYWDYEANDAAGINPHNVLARKGIMARWICPDCGSNYDMAINERIQREDNDQLSCPYCRGRLINETNCLKNTHPELMREWSANENALIEVSATEISDKYNGKAWWICPVCNYKYTMSVQARCLKEKRHQNACPRCNGRLQKRLHFL